MRTKVTRRYGEKVFEKQQLKLFALEIVNYLNMPISEMSIELFVKDGDFETTSDIAVDDLDDININDYNTLSLYFEHINFIMLCPNARGLEIYYKFEKGTDSTKELVLFVEDYLSLERRGSE